MEKTSVANFCAGNYASLYWEQRLVSSITCNDVRHLQRFRLDPEVITTSFHGAIGVSQKHGMVKSGFFPLSLSRRHAWRTTVISCITNNCCVPYKIGNYHVDKSCGWWMCVYIHSIRSLSVFSSLLSPALEFVFSRVSALWVILIFVVYHIFDIYISFSWLCYL